jgi:DNA-binding transcriptional MocR family regulator
MGVRAAIAAYLEKTHRAEADPTLIYLTVGAAAALTITLSAVLPDEGEGEVLLLAPFFPEYRVFAEQAGGRVRVLPLREPDFSIDLHGFHPDAAMQRLRREVESGAHRGKALEVVHGCGRGVLRERVRAWAERSPMVRKIWPGEDCFLPGGGGVTVLFL